MQCARVQACWRLKNFLNTAYMAHSGHEKVAGERGAACATARAVWPETGLPPWLGPGHPLNPKPQDHGPALSSCGRWCPKLNDPYHRYF